jgi:hypothetical protein
MSFVRLANFIELLDGSSSPRRYQNATPGESLQLGGSGPSFEYLSFIYQGAAKNRTGDNLEAAIVLSVNEISQGIAKEAVMKRQQVNVYSVVMESDYSPSTRTLTEETWLAATMTYDYETLEVVLSSGIDAVGANAPTRVLTKQLVGRLPVTGNIQTG